MYLGGTSGSSYTPGTKFSMRRALGKALYIVKESVMGQLESRALLISRLFSIMVIVPISNSQCLPIENLFESLAFQTSSCKLIS